MRDGKRRPHGRGGFTLIELLVVVGIILVLLGILLPIANKIIAAAHKTDTSAEIAKLATAIQNYFNLNGAYPGPIPDNCIWGFNTQGTKGNQVGLPITSPSDKNCVTNMPGAPPITDITSSENAVLGLLGGLTNTPATLPPITFDVLQIANGNGVRNLNPLNPTVSPAYIEFVKTELSQDPSSGAFISYAQGHPQAQVTGGFVIPEFMDHFPNPHPIIYLRARPGATQIADIVMGAAGSPTGTPWYSMEMAPYWTNWTSLNPSDTPPPTITSNQYNAPFPSSSVGLGVGPMWPTEVSFFQNQTLQDGLTPRSIGSFILLSAGADGIYGTQDDIIYSN